jgi:membrane fusion protein (multidrug efflux system)
VEVARRNLQQAELEQKVWQLEVARSRAIARQREVRSPIDGIVTESRLDAGEFVHQEAYILEIAQLDPLHVEVYMPIEMFGRIAPGMTAQVSPQAPIGGLHPARVTIVDKVLDAASGTFGVRLELPNPDFALPAGIRCDVAFPDSSRDDDPEPSGTRRDRSTQANGY